MCCWKCLSTSRLLWMCLFCSILVVARSRPTSKSERATIKPCPSWGNCLLQTRSVTGQCLHLRFSIHSRDISAVQSVEKAEQHNLSIQWWPKFNHQNNISVATLSFWEHFAWFCMHLGCATSLSVLYAYVRFNCEPKTDTRVCINNSLLAS